MVARLEVGDLAELIAALSLSSGRLSRREAAAVIEQRVLCVLRLAL